MLKFALPVLRQALYCFSVSIRLLLSAFLRKRRTGTRFLQVFCKKRDSLGAGARGRGMAGAKPLDFVLLQSKSVAFSALHCEGGMLALHDAT